MYIFYLVYTTTVVLKAIIHVLVTAGALLLISYYVPGITVASFYSALVVAVLWGLFGLTLRPVLNLLALPINILTLGLFSFIISALLFWLLSTFVDGFHVAGFIPALAGSLLLAAAVWILHIIF